MKKYRPHIRSRHPSHNVLRRYNNNLPYLPFKSVIRLGSTTELTEKYLKDRVVLNAAKAIEISSDKFKMKRRFHHGKVVTAEWWTVKKQDNTYRFVPHSDNYVQSVGINELLFPIISKSLNGSRGRGNKKHNNVAQLKKWLDSKDNLDNYIFEKYYNFNREYRLHVNKNGCFYTCRKMLKRDAPKEVRWFRNDANCVWIVEDNPSFDKPVNWDIIVSESVRALKSVGLDFGAIDLRVQSSKDKKGNLRENPEFIIVEINSAPSFGNKTAERYIEVLPKMLNDKWEDTQQIKKDVVLQE